MGTYTVTLALVLSGPPPSSSEVQKSIERSRKKRLAHRAYMREVWRPGKTLGRLQAKEPA